MRFLRTLDYNRQIQPVDLAQIIEGDESLLIFAEQSAQAELTSYLSQRYDISKIFTDTSTYSSVVSYSANTLVEYTEPVFNTATTYSTNKRVSFNGNIYSSVSGSTGVIPNSLGTDWNYITNDKNLYYAITASTGNLPTNTTYFIQGDNRPAQIVLFMIDIVLYHLHSRINPQNIPTLRAIRYDNNGANQRGGAIGWLKMVADGAINAGLPEIIVTPLSNGIGRSIQWGSNPSSRNYY